MPSSEPGNRPLPRRGAGEGSPAGFAPGFTSALIGLVTALLVLVACAPAAAGQEAASRPDPLQGRVVDATSGAPVAGARVVVAPSGEVEVTDPDGRFVLQLADRSAGTTIRIEALGYRSRSDSLVHLVDTGRLAPYPRSAPTSFLDLNPEPLATAGVLAVVPGTRLRSSSGTVTVLDGEGLLRRQGTSVAAVLEGEAGVTSRYNGPAATQPVIRGLSGDRVLVLEDGLRTGDIATTAPDHAITVDPTTAQRLELIRGPAGVLYGSNALGGVVNVVRNDIPLDGADAVGGAIRSGVESATGSRVVAGHAVLPIGSFAVRLGGSLRETGDTRTPAGPLPFTDLSAHDLGAGAGWRGAEAAGGAAVRHLRGTYGVPSSFGDLTLPGAHDGGVYVDYTRTVGRGRFEWRRGGSAATDGPLGNRGTPPALSLVANASAIRFEQSEFEKGGFIGTRFGQLAASGDVVVRRQGSGRWSSSAIGVHGLWRDFRAEGSFTGTRPAVHRAGAVFALQEVRLGRTVVVGAARLDRVRISPLDSTETRLLRGVRTRDFTAATGSLGARTRLWSGLSVGVSVTRAFRPPAIEELFSAGPHLASYAYEIGNPDLRAETGLGTDLVVAWTSPSLAAEVTLFRNALSDFIGYLPALDPETGEPVRDPRLRRYNVYRADQADAVFVGGEATLRLPLSAATEAEASGSWVRGSWVADGSPLPAVPPVRGRAQLTRDVERWFASATVEGIARQGRVPEAPAASGACTVGADPEALLPAEFCPTPGVVLTHLELGWRLDVGGVPGSLVLAVDNLFDRTWRDHLWRAKQVAPQPGRNVRLFLTIEP